MSRNESTSRVVLGVWILASSNWCPSKPWSAQESEIKYCVLNIYSIRHVKVLKNREDKVLEEAARLAQKPPQPHLAPHIERPGPAVTGQIKIDLDH